MSRAASSRQGVRQDGPVALLSAAVGVNVNTHRVPLILEHDVRISGRPRMPLASRPNAKDVQHPRRARHTTKRPRETRAF